MSTEKCNQNKERKRRTRSWSSVIWTNPFLNHIFMLKAFKSICPTSCECAQSLDFLRTVKQIGKRHCNPHSWEVGQRKG